MTKRNLEDLKKGITLACGYRGDTMNTLNKSIKPDSQYTEGSHGISTQEVEKRECIHIIKH